MSADEFGVWWREFQSNPWGEQRDAAHAALICATVSNYAGKVRKQPAELTDFMLDFNTEKAPEAEVDPAMFFKLTS